MDEVLNSYLRNLKVRFDYSLRRLIVADVKRMRYLNISMGELGTDTVMEMGKVCGHDDYSTFKTWLESKDIPFVDTDLSNLSFINLNNGESQ